jgi:hypothetical protein
MYQQDAAAGAGATPGAEGPTPNAEKKQDDNVVDADFKMD